MAEEESRRFTELSRQALSEAELLAQQGFSRGALSRAYYAAFHAVCALLDLKELRARSHRAVVELLHREFVQRGELSREDARDYARLLERRMKADYDPSSSVSIETVEEAISTAQRFLLRAVHAIEEASRADERRPGDD